MRSNIIQDFSAYNEGHTVEARSCSIEDVEVHDCLAAGPERVELFEPSVSGRKACCKDYEGETTHDWLKRSGYSGEFLDWRRQDPFTVTSNVSRRAGVRESCWGGLACGDMMDYSLLMNTYSSSAARDVSAVTRESPRSSRACVVLKFGTRLLTGGTNVLDVARMRTVAKAVASEPSKEVVIVSSGAVAAGFRTLGHTVPPAKIEDRQAAAAVGQTLLMKLWADAFHEVGRDVAQVLLTNDCLSDRRRYTTASRALGALLRAGVVPIVNENDTVSVGEIEVGDNDNLAAMTAALVDANLLALLTDVPGVLSGDPERDPDAHLIPYAECADALRSFCFKKKAAESRGGMVSKLEAAERAGRYGIPTVIASGTREDVLNLVLRGEAAGTFISADERPLSARLHWMAVQKGLKGSLVIDDGAVEAIQGRASLLPRGIIRVEGRFQRGDLVSVVDRDGVEKARGIVRFDDRDVERIRGLHTLEVKQTVGPDSGHVVMRPDWILLAAEWGKE